MYLYSYYSTNSQANTIIYAHILTGTASGEQLWTTDLHTHCQSDDYFLQCGFKIRIRKTRLFARTLLLAVKPECWYSAFSLNTEKYSNLVWCISYEMYTIYRVHVSYSDQLMHPARIYASTAIYFFNPCIALQDRLLNSDRKVLTLTSMWPRDSMT